MIAVGRKIFFGFSLAGFIFFTFPVPQAKAFEPVTMSLLAPILLPYAKKAVDYTFKGMGRTVPHWVDAGVDLLNILRLPLGLMQIFLGAPFGFLSSGINNTWKGFISPFLFVKEILCMPLYFSGLMK